MTTIVTDECSQPNLEGKPDKVSNLWPRSWLKTDFPVLQNAFGRSLRGTASADAQRTPSSSREYAEAACADWSTQSALLLGRQPPRGEQWATSLRSTTATWLSLQLSESHHNSRCERYPKGQEAVWASASSCAWRRNNKSRPIKHADVRASPLSRGAARRDTAAKAGLLHGNW